VNQESKAERRKREDAVLSTVRVPPFCVATNIHDGNRRPLRDGGHFGDSLYETIAHGGRAGIAEQLRALAGVIERTRSVPEIDHAQIVVLFSHKSVKP
jgi:hypothetical protein